MILKVEDNNDFTISLRQFADLEERHIGLYVMVEDHRKGKLSGKAFLCGELDDALLYYEKEKKRLLADTEVEKREFYVNTPLGKLRVYAKTEKDSDTEFPGVFVELLSDFGQPLTVGCVEYDPAAEKLLTTVYDSGSEIPADTHYHNTGGYTVIKYGDDGETVVCFTEHERLLSAVDCALKNNMDAVIHNVSGRRIWAKGALKEKGQEEKKS